MIGRSFLLPVFTDEIAFHAIDYLNVDAFLLEFSGSIGGFWKGLHNTMVSDCNGRPAPLCRLIDDITGTHHRVHWTHTSVAMQFYSLNGRIVLPFRICRFAKYINIVCPDHHLLGVGVRLSSTLYLYSMLPLKLCNERFCRFLILLVVELLDNNSVSLVNNAKR